jgi:hypothetical protein
MCPSSSLFTRIIPIYINVLGKKGTTEHSEGNETVPGKVATTRTEDGHI